MSFLRLVSIILVVVFQCFFLTNISFAHPASGIVVDSKGHIYFLYHGLVQINPSGKLTTIQTDTGGHWLALDERDVSSKRIPAAYKRVTSDGVTLVFGDGAPLAIAADGNLYYGSNGSEAESFPTGAMTVAKLSSDGRRSLFAPLLKQKLEQLHDGITGLAPGPDGSIYAATWNGIVILKRDGSIAKVVNPVVVKDCDSDPADHNPANASPFFRGLAVDSGGNVYLPATSCHRVLKITPAGQVISILKSERPWSPTGVAISGKDIYVLEYTHPNGPPTEGWYPRVRKLTEDNTMTTLVTLAPELASPSR